MQQIYCGAGKLPKNHRFGTLPECVEKKQIRLYGIRKVDRTSLAKLDDKTPVTREKLLLKLSELRGKSMKYKRAYDIEVGRKDKGDKKKKEEYQRLWKGAVKEANEKILPRLRKIEEERNKGMKIVANQKREAEMKKKKKNDNKITEENERREKARILREGLLKKRREREVREENERREKARILREGLLKKRRERLEREERERRKKQR